MLNRRYDRNQPTLSPEDQATLGASTVAILGVGGLGGWQAQYLARIGVGHIILIDGDDFSVSNLNRQVFANEANLGRAKVEETASSLRGINSEVQVETHKLFLNSLTQVSYLEGSDLIMDGADNIALRQLIEGYATSLNIPWVHGAIGAWEGQCGIFTPDSGALKKLYPAKDKTQLPQAGNLSFVVSNIASLQAGLAVQHLLSRPSCPYNRLYRIDYQNMESVSFSI